MNCTTQGGCMPGLARPADSAAAAWGAHAVSAWARAIMRLRRLQAGQLRVGVVPLWREPKAPNGASL